MEEDINFDLQFDDDDDCILVEAANSTDTDLNLPGQPSHSRNKDERVLEPDEMEGNISIGCEQSEGLAMSQRDVSGYDRRSGQVWIYPTNYPVRDYQYNIVQQALFRNTLVVLPTGLGKTFIAAVVMYNLYRWFPQGKVVFMAPTKPLVAQQIQACYNIMGIPKVDTIEMTGNIHPSVRATAWRQKRVVFLTPQVMTNDISRGSCVAGTIKCVVVDEAHKALGNHAYCQVIRELINLQAEFRVLALSATPGGDLKAVQQVMGNLLISHIELRSEDSIDIRPYTHERKVEKIVVPMGEELNEIRLKYVQIMQMVTQRLIRMRVLFNREATKLSKFLILKARDEYRQNPPQNLQPAQYGNIEGDFALAMSIYHGFELLQLHGLRSLYNFLLGIKTGEKGYGRTRVELMRCPQFNEVMDVLESKFAIQPGSSSNLDKDQKVIVGHPKMQRLEEVVLAHFKSFQEKNLDTRVMIFSQYRDSVEEIRSILDQHQPLIKVMAFIGQSSSGKATKGYTQKEQLKVMRQFREGGYNTLVSTCVGEEGLDIGDVDLIICFDAHKSPIRLVQRMGRTGRRRAGRIVMLVTQGKEEQIYQQSLYSKKSIHKAIVNGARTLHFYTKNPKLIPPGVEPKCHKMFITVKQDSQGDAKQPTAKSTTKERRKTQGKATSIADVFTKQAEGKESQAAQSRMEYQEIRKEFSRLNSEAKHIQRSKCLVLKNGKGTSPHGNASDGPAVDFCEWMPWQNRLQKTHLIGHSTQSVHLVKDAKFIELQQSIGDSGDAYEIEMDMYLNQDDIIKGTRKDDNSTIVGQGSIESFLVPSQRWGDDPGPSASTSHHQDTYNVQGNSMARRLKQSKAKESSINKNHQKRSSLFTHIKDCKENKTEDVIELDDFVNENDVAADDENVLNPVKSYENVTLRRNKKSKRRLHDPGNCHFESKSAQAKRKSILEILSSNIDEDLDVIDEDFDAGVDLETLHGPDRTPCGSKGLSPHMNKSFDKASEDNESLCLKSSNKPKDSVPREETEAIMKCKQTHIPTPPRVEDVEALVSAINSPSAFDNIDLSEILLDFEKTNEPPLRNKSTLNDFINDTNSSIDSARKKRNFIAEYQQSDQTKGEELLSSNFRRKEVWPDIAYGEGKIVSIGKENRSEYPVEPISNVLDKGQPVETRRLSLEIGRRGEEHESPSGSPSFPSKRKSGVTRTTENWSEAVEYLKANQNDKKDKDRSVETLQVGLISGRSETDSLSCDVEKNSDVDCLRGTPCGGGEDDNDVDSLRGTPCGGGEGDNDVDSLRGTPCGGGEGDNDVDSLRGTPCGGGEGDNDVDSLRGTPCGGGEDDNDVDSLRGTPCGGGEGDNDVDSLRGTPCGGGEGDNDVDSLRGTPCGGGEGDNVSNPPLMDTLDSFVKELDGECESLPNERLVSEANHSVAGNKSLNSTSFATFTQAMACLHSSSSENVQREEDESQESNVSSYKQTDLEGKSLLSQRRSASASKDSCSRNIASKHSTEKDSGGSKESDELNLDRLSAQGLSDVLRKGESVYRSSQRFLPQPDSLADNQAHDSDDDFLPHFELGFDLEDEVIPPTPDKSKSSLLHSSTERLKTQLFGHRKRKAENSNALHEQDDMTPSDVKKKVNFDCNEYEKLENENLSSKLPSVERVDGVSTSHLRSMNESDWGLFEEVQHLEAMGAPDAHSDSQEVEKSPAFKSHPIVDEENESLFGSGSKSFTSEVKSHPTVDQGNVRSHSDKRFSQNLFANSTPHTKGAKWSEDDRVKSPSLSPLKKTPSAVYESKLIGDSVSLTSLGKCHKSLEEDISNTPKLPQPKSAIKKKKLSLKKDKSLDGSANSSSTGNESLNRKFETSVGIHDENVYLEQGDVEGKASTPIRNNFPKATMSGLSRVAHLTPIKGSGVSGDVHLDSDESFVVGRKRKGGAQVNVITDEESGEEPSVWNGKAKRQQSDVSCFRKKGKTKEMAIIQIDDDDEDDFQGCFVKEPTPDTTPIRHKKQHKKPRKRAFLDEEAMESGDQASSDEDEDQADDYEASFVDNRTEMTQTQGTDMRAVYLKSVKSPPPRGLTKASYRLDSKGITADIYSQALPEDQGLSEYEEDSFCVGSDEEDDSVSNESLSSPIKKRWKKRKDSKKVVQGKRRLRVLNASSSDDDREAPVIMTQEFSMRGRKTAANALMTSSEDDDDSVLLNANGHLPAKTSLTDSKTVLNGSSDLRDTNRVISLPPCPQEDATSTDCQPLMPECVPGGNFDLLNMDEWFNDFDEDNGTEPVVQRCDQLNKSDEPFEVKKMSLTFNQSTTSDYIQHNKTSDSNSDLLIGRNSSLSSLDSCNGTSGEREQTANGISDNNDKFKSNGISDNNDKFKSKGISDNNDKFKSKGISDNNDKFKSKGISDNNDNLKSKGICDGNVSVASTSSVLSREERLKRQKEKQERYRQKLAQIQKQSAAISSSVVSIENEDRSETHESSTVLRHSLSGVSAGREDKNETSKTSRQSMSDASSEASCSFTKPLQILVDSREISGAQEIISALRLKHKVTVTARQLSACDYIVSNTMAVDRLQWSEFGNSSNRTKLSSRLRDMQTCYTKCVVVVEADRVKVGQEKAARPVHHTKYLDKTLAFVIQTGIKIYFTNNAEQTATLLFELCEMEQKKGRTFGAPTSLNSRREEMLAFITSFPNITMAEGLNLVHGFRSIAELVSSPVKLIQDRGHMPEEKAQWVHSFLRHHFDLQMTPASKR